MDANQRRLRLGKVTIRQRKMRFIRDPINKGMQSKFAMRPRHFAGRHPLHQRLGLAAVMNQIGDSADFEPMLLGKRDQFRQTGHAAIVVHDFTDDRGRFQTGHLCQIAAGFGMSGTDQHAPGLCGQREYVAGLNQIGRFRVPRHGSQHGGRTVMRRNACRHALRRLDGHRKCRAVRSAVVAHHLLQIELPATRFGQGQADQAASEFGHEIDGFRRAMFGRNDEITFIFAIFLIHQNHHPAGTKLGDNLFNRRNDSGSGTWGHQDFSPFNKRSQ